MYKYSTLQMIESLFKHPRFDGGKERTIGTFNECHYVLLQRM